MSVLDDLWYGNYAPQERIGAGGREYKELLGLVVLLREKLEAGLDEAKRNCSKANRDNHANQCNPNNAAYQQSRGGGKSK